MNDANRLTHSVWDCKYHIVWIPKCRRKSLYGGIAKDLGKIFHELAGQRECKIVEGHVCPDHIHMLIEIPPKYAVSAVVGYIKGKSAIAIAELILGNGKTSADKTSGHENILYQQWGEMRLLSKNISRNRKQRINGKTNWKCSEIANNNRL